MAERGDSARLWSRFPRHLRTRQPDLAHTAGSCERSEPWSCAGSTGPWVRGKVVSSRRTPRAPGGAGDAKGPRAENQGNGYSPFAQRLPMNKRQADGPWAALKANAPAPLPWAQMPPRTAATGRPNFGWT